MSTTIHVFLKKEPRPEEWLFVVSKGPEETEYSVYYSDFTLKKTEVAPMSIDNFIGLMEGMGFERL